MFQIDPDGIYIPVEGNKYADQKKVYEEIGSEILVNAWYSFVYVGKATIVVCLLMAKQGQARVIQCWVMGLIKESFLKYVIKFL